MVCSGFLQLGAPALPQTDRLTNLIFGVLEELDNLIGTGWTGTRLLRQGNFRALLLGQTFSQRGVGNEKKVVSLFDLFAFGSLLDRNRSGSGIG
jgi:hypothetical protein